MRLAHCTSRTRSGAQKYVWALALAPVQVCSVVPVDERTALLPVLLCPVLTAVGCHRRVGRVAGHGVATLWSLAQAEVRPSVRAVPTFKHTHHPPQPLTGRMTTRACDTEGASSEHATQKEPPASSPLL